MMGVDSNSNYDQKICARCIMDTSDPEITFDEEGVCNHCKAYDIRARYELYDPKTSRVKLDKLVDQIKKDGLTKEYDCVIGVSGGVDSTMVAYTLKQLGLRPLAVHFDNGWGCRISGI